MKKFMWGVVLAGQMGVMSVFAASTQVRSMSSTSYTPGQPVTVTITVTPDTNVKAYAIEETPPDNWSIDTTINNGGSAVAGVVKWGVFIDNTPRTFTYTITPTANQSGAKTFTGKVSYDGSSLGITGTTSLPSSGVSGQSPTSVTQFLPFTNVFNPTKDTLTVKYSVEGGNPTSDDTLTVYDSKANKIKVLALSSSGQSVWDGRNEQNTVVASGTYLVILGHGGKVVKTKVVVVK